jgi:signal peptidase II
MANPNPTRPLIQAYGAVLLLAALDQVTKQMALALVFSPPRVIEVLPFFNLVPVWNSGMSFGLLSQGGDGVKIGLTVIALLVAALLPLFSRSWDGLSRLGAVMMASGALGNAVDRIIYGRVIDFIDVFAGQYHWPAFNVADIAVTTGAGCLLWASISGRAARHAAEQTQDETPDEKSGDGI